MTADGEDAMTTRETIDRLCKLWPTLPAADVNFLQDVEDRPEAMEQRELRRLEDLAEKEKVTA